MPALLSPISTTKPSSYVLLSCTISPRKLRWRSRLLQSGISARRQGSLYKLIGIQEDLIDGNMGKLVLIH